MDQPLTLPDNVVVRPSTEEDVPAMLAIYAHHVRNGVNVEDPEPLHDEDIKRRRKNMLKRKLPHLVAERAGTIVGYAYAVPFRKRPAYRYAVKHSIYVHPDHLHSGVGRALLPALIDACGAVGFRRAGLLEGVGYKFGRWTDSLLMQRVLGPGTAEAPSF